MKVGSGMRRLNRRGFTVIELLVVILTMTIILGIAVPSMNQWRLSLAYKNLSTQISQMLREARARAVSTNREHRVEFNIAGGQYRLTQGNASSGSAVWNAVRPWVAIPANTVMLRDTGGGCVDNTNVNIVFRPNGTSDAAGLPTGGRICVLDVLGATRYRIDISSVTGSIQVN